MTKKAKTLAEVYGLPAGIPDNRAHDMALARDAFMLRADGCSYAEIAKRMEVSVQTAKARCDRWAAHLPLEVTQEALMLEATRLDQMLEVYMSSARSGDLKSASFVLQISERRAKLFGHNYSDQLATRQVELEEGKARLVALALSRTLDSVTSLTPAQRAAAQDTFIGLLSELPKEIDV